MTTDQDRLACLRRLHDTWCRVTGVPVPWSFSRECSWGRWLQDVAPAIADSEWPQTTPERLLDTALRRRIRVAKSKPDLLSALIRFERVTGNPDACIEDWAVEMADRKRRLCPAGKAGVLRATGRPSAPEPPPARIASEIIESGLDAMRKALNSPDTR